MKKFLIFIVLFSSAAFTQEICDNGLDDDGDSFVDLNDTDCDCEGIDGFSTLIPNPSFDDTLCCPELGPLWDCAEDWIQASYGTSDYFNLCGVTLLGDPMIPPDLPLPDGGYGYGGFFESSPTNHEMIGACLDSPMLSGVTYTLKFFMASGETHPTSIIPTFYGTPNCADLPWAGLDCPVGIDGWELLASSPTIFFVGDGAWQEITLSYTPPLDIEAVAIGGPCGLVLSSGYFYIDGLVLIDNAHFTEITETGSWCDGDLTFSTEIDTFGGTWQWYKDGVALVGETGESVDVSGYGMGTYTAQYLLSGSCLRLSKSVYFDDAVDADFTFENVCLGETIAFENVSTIPEGGSPTWEWDFGDGGTSTDESPSHTFATAGTYTVRLVGINDLSCNDTAEYEVVVYRLPLADIEFIAGGLSSELGSTGGCIENPVQFNDLSTIPAPYDITDWLWNFGDGGTSTTENPNHSYVTIGTYTITLTVTSENGCVSTTTQTIVMTDGLALELTVSEPSCFGFSDGSVTANVVGPGDELIFEITDVSGTLRNIDNSNTANNLTTGWYYVNVEDGSACSGIDSVFLNEPTQITIDLTAVDPICYDGNSGWARVDSVYNPQGDYNGISYFWNPNPAGNGGLGEDSTWALTAGNYVLTINDANGCSNNFDFELSEPDSLYFTEFGIKPAYCRLYGYQSGSGVVFGAAAGGVPDYSYEWIELATGETDDHSTWGGLNPGYYQLNVTDAIGCVLTKTVFLDSLNPIADFVVNSAQLNTDNKGTAFVEVEFVNNSSNFSNPEDPDADTTFFWNLSYPTVNWQISNSWFETFDTIYGPKGDSYLVDVCLVALNKNGCTDTTCKLLTIFEPIKFEPINIFSPNNDGINDLFTFDFKAASIDEFNCQIVDRWGVVVNEIPSIDQGWNGTTKNGSPCPDGVYFYYYKAVSDNGTKLNGQGTVQLIRGN
jgi:gliding motility-associated-like protein